MTKRKKLASILICSAVLFSNVGISFAASYADMSKHWAESYVQNIKDKQIISGYEDGSFKPDKSVSKIEAIIMVTKMFNMQTINQVYASNKQTWESKFITYSIPDWSWPYMVYALEKQIIPGSDEYLTTVMDTKNKKNSMPAPRYEVMVYMINALNMKSELPKTAVLKYKDIQSIPPQAIPYIDLMIKKGIIGEKGDPDGNFAAMRAVTRGEMAVMISNAYEYASQITPSDTVQVNNSTITTDVTNVDTQTTIASTGTQAVVNNSYSVIDGVVELISTSGENTSFTISTASGLLQSFSNENSKIQFKIGNTPASLKDLKMKDKVKVLYEDGNKVRNVIIADKEQKISGVFSGTGMGTTIQLIKDGQIQSYVYDSSTFITLDGVSVPLGQIKANDQLEIVVVAGRATEIKAYTTRDSISQPNPIISPIKKAVISKILIYPDKTQIVVVDSYQKEYTLDVSIDSRIKIDGRRSTVNDLNLGYEVDVYLNGTVIDEIISDGSYKQAVFNGKVSYLDERNRTIDMVDNNGKIKKVYFDNNTIIQDLKNDRMLRPSQIYVGDGLTVIGVENYGGIEATKIMVSIEFY